MADVLHQVQSRRRRLSSNSSTNAEDFEDEALDPRIQVELEKLNKASDEINKLELELDDARASFRQVLSDSIQKLNVLAKKLGSCVDKARPYYDARVKAKEVHMETHKAALRFERACSMHEAAKEMVQLAEQGYQRREQDADPAWQEMLNHATMKVNEAESERMESESEHQRTMMLFKDSEAKVQHLQKDLKRAINKSNLSCRRSFLRLSDIANQHWLEVMPYFEMKSKFNQIMEDQKGRVSRLEEDVTSSKSLYSQALHSLEAISDDIHQQRLEKQKKIQLGVREAGVGAESPSPPPKGKVKMDGSVTPHSTSCDNVTETAIASRNSPQQMYSDSAIKTFLPPSVIFINPEDARRQSYRSAIENSQNSQQKVVSPGTDSLCSADYDEDFDVPCLEEEYLALPSKRKVLGAENEPSSSKSKPRPVKSHPLETSEEEIFPWNENTKLQSKPIQIASRNRNMSMSSSPGSPSYLVHRHLQSAGSTPDTSSPLSGSPRQKTKLQGLILRVDPGMDPLGAYQQQFNTIKENTQQYSKSPGSAQGAMRPSSSRLPSQNLSGTAQGPSSSSTSSKDTENPSSKFIRPNVTQKSLSPDINTQIDRLNSLKIPESFDSADDNSDSESIASGGPMLDDDQVEYLTLDFSTEQSKNSSANSTSSPRQHWSRMSLPPNLSYLEGYIDKKKKILSPDASKIDEEQPSEDDGNISSATA